MHNPSPEEIRNVCREIRKKWTKNQRRERKLRLIGIDRVEFKIPICRVITNGPNQYKIYHGDYPE